MVIELRSALEQAHKEFTGSAEEWSTLQQTLRALNPKRMTTAEVQRTFTLFTGLIDQQLGATRTLVGLIGDLLSDEALWPKSGNGE